MDPTVPELLNKLAAHGSAQQIADYFRQEGIQGRPRQGTQCPVARLITRETGGQGTVAPTTNAAEDPSFASSGYGPGYPMPSVVNEFALQFDKGTYEDLIER